MPESVSISFKLPFVEAIAAMAARGVILPDVYYGELQGIARQKAFSIAGITSLDQLQAVKDSLEKFINQGGSFNNWKKEQAVIDLGLPKHRLDNIWRTNLQGQYMAGKWEKFERFKSSRPYLMYDAINDSRVRPAHLALDGIIRPVGDAFFATHSPPCGYRCRCSLISLTEKQAHDRSPNNKGLNQQPVLENGEPALPDKGWDYDKTGRMTGIEKALKDKPQGVLKSVLEKRLVEKSTMIDKHGFADFIEKVTAKDYKARHEFVRVGTLPDFVMADSSVTELEPINNEIHVSDYQLRHSQRPEKSVPLSIDDLKLLPEKLDNSRWFFDSSHDNLIAVFDIAKGESDVGKAAIAINFAKKKKLVNNSIITSGVIDISTLLMGIYREIKDEP